MCIKVNDFTAFYDFLRLFQKFCDSKITLLNKYTTNELKLIKWGYCRISLALKIIVGIMG